MTDSPSLVQGLLEQSEFDGVFVGSDAAGSLVSWGPPEASGRGRYGSVIHRWGGVQLTADRAGVVLQLGVVFLPYLPPKPSRLLHAYEVIRSLKRSDLPDDTAYLQQLSDEDQRGFSRGRVVWIFEVASQSLAKIVIS